MRYRKLPTMLVEHDRQGDLITHWIQHEESGVYLGLAQDEKNQSILAAPFFFDSPIRVPNEPAAGQINWDEAYDIEDLLPSQVQPLIELAEAIGFKSLRLPWISLCGEG